MTKKVTFVLIAILLILALVAMIVPAFYARFMADDYCMNAGAQNTSLLSFFESVYRGWSGRFAYITLTYFLSRIPPQFFGMLVTTVLLFWLYVLARAISGSSQLFKKKLSRVESLILVLVLLIALFKSIPNLYQDLYWRDGLVNYIIPLVFTSLSFLLLSNILQTELTFTKAGALSISTLFSAGFSESASIANVTLWLTLCILISIFNKSQKIVVLKTLGIATLGALLGFLIEFFAPGNLVRSGILPDKPGIVELTGLTLRNVAHLYGRLLTLNFTWALFCLIIGLYFGYTAIDKPEQPHSKGNSPIRNWFVGSALVNFLLGSGVCAAVAYLMKAYPDDRIIIIPYFFALLTILMTGLRIGKWLNARKPASDNPKNCHRLIGMSPYILIGMACVIAFTFASDLRKNLPGLAAYAQRWDARDALIRAEVATGKRDLIIPGLESRYGLPDLQLEKEDWVNRCIADYYGANSITGR